VFPVAGCAPPPSVPPKIDAPAWPAVEAGAAGAPKRPPVVGAAAGLDPKSPVPAGALLLLLLLLFAAAPPPPNRLELPNILLGVMGC
jgi:hypothetical protein